MVSFSEPTQSSRGAGAGEINQVLSPLQRHKQGNNCSPDWLRLRLDWQCPSCCSRDHIPKKELTKRHHQPWSLWLDATQQRNTCQMQKTIVKTDRLKALSDILGGGASSTSFAQTPQEEGSSAYSRNKSCDKILRGHENHDTTENVAMQALLGLQLKSQMGTRLGFTKPSTNYHACPS